MPRVKVQQSGKRSLLQAFFVHETARVLAFVAGEAILTQANACPFLPDRVFPAKVDVSAALVCLQGAGSGYFAD